MPPLYLGSTLEEILYSNCGGRSVEEEGDTCDNCLDK